MQERKKPERKCLGCNQMKLKSDLIRIVRLPDGEVTLDKTGKKSGRGAYICHDIKCFRLARKSKRPDHQLKVTIPEEIWDLVEVDLASGE